MGFIKNVSDLSAKEEKIEKLKEVALETVDIKGIGFYTLGKHRKNLNDQQKKEYSELFNKYFLKSCLFCKAYKKAVLFKRPF